MRPGFGVPPGAGAVIDASGTYSVTISTAVLANSLTLDASGATVAETAAGSLTLAGALILEAGTFKLNAGTMAVGATAANEPTASPTLSGYSSADLHDGRSSVSFGAAQDGNPYMHIFANS